MVPAEWQSADFGCPRGILQDISGLHETCCTWMGLVGLKCRFKFDFHSKKVRFKV